MSDAARWGLGVLVVVLLLALVMGGCAVSTNNNLVSLQENVDASWGQVESVLQRRFDLIPNLVSTVKGYAKHEKEILEEVTRLRSQWGNAKTVEDKAKAASQLEGTLSRLLVVSEQYPDLKANQNFRDLQVELAGTENRINVERQRYNQAIRDYNTAVRQFPGSLIASFRGFTPKEGYFEAEARAKSAPKVNFDDDSEKKKAEAE
jgi:LemA protein